MSIRDRKEARNSIITNSEVRIIEWDGRALFAVVPVELWHEVLEKAEMLEDVEVLRRVRQELERDETELVPQEVAERLLRGEHPLGVWREHRRASQQELAERTGLGQACLARIEGEKRKGNIDAYRHLAEALGVEIDDLVD